MRCAIAGVVVLAGMLIAVADAAPNRVYTRHCPAARWNTSPAFPSTARDLTAGPLRVVAFKAVFANAKAEDVYTPSKGGPRVLKAAINILGRRDVTVIVPRADPRVLSLDYRPEGGAAPRTVAGGKHAVRFEVCPHGKKRSTGYAGGWLYSGPWPACVRMNFKVEGRPGLIRRSVPLGAGKCAQPR